MKAKIWSLFFAMGLLALAAQGQDSFTCTTNSGSITITGYTGTDAVVEIPALINGYPVTEIAVSAFYSNSVIESVVMPDTVTSFPNGSLQSRAIFVPDGIAYEYWYDGVFAGCINLTNVVLSGSLTNIGAGAFYGCSKLPGITIPAGVVHIGNVAFYECTNLTSVTFLGNAPAAANQGATYANPSLVFKDVPATVYYYYPATGFGEDYLGRPAVELGIPFNYTVADGVATITSYFGTNSSPVIIEKLNGYPVVAIEPNAFASSNVKSVVVYPTVTNIGASAFSNCTSLTNIMFLGEPPALGSGAFNNADSLTVYYYSDVSGWGATFGGRPTSGVLPYIYVINDNTVTITGHLGPGVDLTVPDSIEGYPVVKIGDHAFGDVDMRTISLPGSVTHIGKRAFENCIFLTNLVLPENLIHIDEEAFYRALYAGHITIPSSMTSIGDNAFKNSAIWSVDIPNTVTNIGKQAFANSFPGSPRKLVIPGSVKTIGEAAFAQCNMEGYVEIQEGVEVIDGYAFTECEFLKGVTLPNSLKYIGDFAFYNARLTDLFIPNNVTHIGHYAFFSCTWLTNVSLPPNLTLFGEGAFYACPELRSVTFRGDAPSINTWHGWFDGLYLNEVNAYYYYGSKGWGTNLFEGGSYLIQQGLTLNELTWSPPIENAGVQNGSFQFSFANPDILPVVVEASADLVNWQPVWTNAYTASSTNFVDPEWTNYPIRFYRTR